MKDQPIQNQTDPNYTIKYDEKAMETYNKYFSEKDSDVIFLNGPWGSGKTSFLNIIFENKNNIKVKIVDLWRVTDNEKSSLKIYKKVFPVTYWIIRYTFLILFIIFNGLALWLSKNDFTQLSYALFLSGFLSGLNQIIGKIDYENIFLTFLKWRGKYTFFLKKRVIVIDDFDRIHSVKQNDLYKIFNLLNNPKIQFLFLGDYTKINNNKSGYLQKIINRRIELPYSLTPSNIWNNYFNDLINEVNEKRGWKLTALEITNIDKLRMILIIRNQPLRDKKIFQNYVDEFLFTSKRYDKVNLDQQLVIIFLYLFDTEMYNILINNIEKILQDKLNNFSSLFNESEDKESKSFEVTIMKYLPIDNNPSSELINELIMETLFSYSRNISLNDVNTKYVFENFENNFPNYLINFVPINITGIEIKTIINKSNNIERFISTINEDKDLEIYNFLRRNQNGLSDNEIDKLVRSSINIISKGYEREYQNKSSMLSNFVSLIFSIYKYRLRINGKNIEKYHEDDRGYFDNLEVSQKLKIYFLYFNISFPDLRIIFSNEYQNGLNDINKLSNFMYPEYILALKFDSINDMDSTTISSLVSLDDIDFFNTMHLFSLYSYSNDLAKVTIKDESIKNPLKNRVNKLQSPYPTKIEIV